MIRVSDLDRRICDVEKAALNTQTYREYIHDNDCNMTDDILDSMADDELDSYLTTLVYIDSDDCGC